MKPIYYIEGTVAFSFFDICYKENIFGDTFYEIKIDGKKLEIDTDIIPNALEAMDEVVNLQIIRLYGIL